MAATLTGPISGISPGLPGGVQAAYNITGPQVIKPAKGVLCKISVQAAVTAITINDCSATGNAAITNQIYTNTALAVGDVVELDWPCATGITVSALTGTISMTFG